MLPWRNFPVARLMSRVLMLGLVLSLAGCSWFKDHEDETAGWSASQLYSAGKANLQEGDYEGAIRFYELLQSRYPFGKYALQSELEAAYAYYRYDENESAIAALDRFIKTHPRHPNVDYAHYLKGLVNFTASRGLVERYLPQDRSQRDPGAALQSFADLSELVQRFPDSKYSEDARLRMLFLRNNLAAYEVHVARYYMRRGAYLAAANRAKYVVENYQRTPAMPEALAMLVLAYEKLELPELAKDAQRVLDLNYPDYAGLNDDKPEGLLGLPIF